MNKKDKAEKTLLDEYLEDPEFARLLAQEELIVEVTETLCELLDKEKISRKELAERLGKSKGFVSQLLNGGRNLTLRTVADILRVLGYKVTLTPEKVKGSGRGQFMTKDTSPILSNQPLAPLTTYRIGGPAQNLAVPHDLEDVYRLMRLAQDRGWPLWFLGRGSNVLIDDAGLPGLTLHLARSLQKIDFQEEVLRVGAGVSLPQMARAAANFGVSGFEFLAGIPGTVGAAVRLNAGADGQSVAGVLRRVWVATPRLQLLEFKAEELDLDYRSSLLLRFPHWLVSEAEFALPRRTDKETVLARLRQLLAARRLRQPANPRSCGSVFKNPPGGPPAGLLIDQAGFKGRRVGDAVVSEKHANFILNRGHATAADIKALISQIQEAVWRTHNLALAREVVFLPEDLV